MKNLRHTLHFNFTAFFAVLVISILSCFFFSTSSASAFSYYVDRPTGIGLQRSFINSSGQTILNQSYATLNSYPQNVLSQDPLNYLLGFRFNAIDIRNNGYKTYNTVYFDTVISANTAALFSAAYDTFDMSIRLLANNTFQQGSCEVSEVQSNYIRYHCVVASTANFKPDYLYVTFGNYNYQQGQAYWGQAISQILITYAGWGFDAQDDPNTAYLQQITFQNQQIISQNQQIIDNTAGTKRAIENQTRQQHEDYENEVEREEAKQEELEDQADDLSLSAQSTGNPFASLFTTNSCITLTSISSWFNVSPAIQICSPYPESIRPILTFVTSAVVVGLLIRLYYKNLKGGFAS